MKRVHPVPLLLLSLAVMWLLGACSKGGDTKNESSRETVASTADTTTRTRGHPDLVGTAASGDQSQALQCSEHQVPEKECGICHPELAESLRPGQGLKIRFPSVESAAKAGIAASPVAIGDGGAFVEAMGRLEFNQNQSAEIASPVEGQVVRVLVDLGQAVQKGQVLVEINSQAWGESLAEEKAAYAALQREETLHRERVSSARDLEEAQARYETARAARQAAEGSGATGLSRSDSPEPRLALRAPVSGTVVSRTASIGEVATPGSVLVEIADLDPLWAMLSLPEESAAGLETGAAVELSSRGATVATGHIDWIASVVDPGTRMVQVRAVIPNPKRVLRAGAYVEARIRTGGLANTVLVPTENVARFGGQPFVFLELSPDLYEVRRVNLSGETDGTATVVAGLHKGDRLVYRQSYLVKSEFQKSRLGAGCVD